MPFIHVVFLLLDAIYSKLLKARTVSAVRVCFTNAEVYCTILSLKF